MPHEGMKKGVLILTAVLFIILVAGCVGGNSEEVELGADSDTGSDADTDTDTDSNEDSDGSGGDGDRTGIDAPEPYTDAEVAFVVDGEERGELAVEVPDNTDEIEKGLMGRESLPNGTGMLFIYPDELVGQRRFWMKNTLVPLDIIFVDSNGRVVNIEHASPGFEGERTCSNPDYYCSDGPAQFVVEAERGYANRTGISPGDELVIR
jgi:uncharacterized membrane protein (UPF0127 family)